MQRLVSLVLAFTAVGVLAGCANSSGSLGSVPELSKSCVYSVILEWGPTKFVTRQEAIGAMVASYEVELERASEFNALDPSADDSPVRLAIIVRGLTAALDQVEEAETRADPKETNLIVVGTLNGAPISEVFVDKTGDGTYVVSQFISYGFTSDDPYCA